MIVLFAEEQVAIASKWLGKSMVTGGLVNECEFVGNCRIIVFTEYYQQVRNCEADRKSEIILSEAISSPIPRFYML